MLPTSPVATRCHACKALFWVADAPRLGELDVDGPGSIQPAAASEVSAATAAAWEPRPRWAR